MSADIILFVPRSNHKADRAFWIGPEQEKLRDALLAKPDDTAPSGYVAPPEDCA